MLSFSLFFLSEVTASQVFSCSLCPFSYTAQIYLHKHIKRSHTDEYVRLLRSGEIRSETLAPCRSGGGGNSQQTQTHTQTHTHTPSATHSCRTCKHTSVRSHT